MCQLLPCELVVVNCKQSEGLLVIVGELRVRSPGLGRLATCSLVSSNNSGYCPNVSMYYLSNCGESHRVLFAESKEVYDDFTLAECNLCSTFVHPRH